LPVLRREWGGYTTGRRASRRGMRRGRDRECANMGTRKGGDGRGDDERTDERRVCAGVQAVGVSVITNVCVLRSIIVSGVWMSLHYPL